MEEFAIERPERTEVQRHVERLERTEVQRHMALTCQSSFLILRKAQKVHNFVHLYALSNEGDTDLSRKIRAR